VMLGALAASHVLPFEPTVLLETILEDIPSKYREINKKAFQGGMDALKKK
jgi:indolepyruvate ferredoxin oxidoreductase beta subunit